MEEIMKKYFAKLMTIVLIVMLLFALTLSSINAKTKSGYYVVSGSVCMTFKKKGKKLSVKTKKGFPIEYYKKNNYHTMKYIGRSKVFKISKKCKYYYTTVSETTKLYDTKRLEKLTFTDIKDTVRYVKKYPDSGDFGLLFKVKKGYVTKMIIIDD
jgi:hypothetical protein